MEIRFFSRFSVVISRGWLYNKYTYGFCTLYGPIKWIAGRFSGNLPVREPETGIRGAKAEVREQPHKRRPKRRRLPPEKGDITLHYLDNAATTRVADAVADVADAILR